MAVGLSDICEAANEGDGRTNPMDQTDAIAYE